jgi:hypothetical protein
MDEPEAVEPERTRGRGAFFRVRVGVLLAILLGVVLFAWRDVRRRHGRTTWDRPLDVALVILRDGPVDPDAVAAMRARLPALSDRLGAEMHRHGAAGTRPFFFTLHGPVDVTAPPPLRADDGFADAVQRTLALRAYLADVDGRAGVDSGAYDARIYVVVRPPVSRDRMGIEGASEDGGHVGSVQVELDASMVDFALFVATHELLHTLGATDKYDATGHALDPDGLAEPALSPRYPQRLVEVMARSRPLGGGLEVPPESLDELSVGAKTAQEIGWLREAPQP